MSKRAGSGLPASNPYQRTLRSDALQGLEQQVQDIQRRMRDYAQPQVQELSSVLQEVRADLKQLRELMLSEAEQTHAALAEIRQCMNAPLPPPPSADTSFMVECLDRVTEIVRLQTETSGAMAELLVKSSKRPRV